MQEFNNTAINESTNTDCIYFNECYLQVRNNGYCFSKCEDFHSQLNDTPTIIEALREVTADE